MFLRCKVRKKNGKEHRSWSIVENRRVAGGRVVQRHVLYLGEINDSQQLAWRKSVEMFPEEEPRRAPTTAALFPEDGGGACVAKEKIVRLRLGELKLVPSPTVGGLLAGAAPVAGVGVGPVLGATLASQPQRHTLGSGAGGADVLPAAFAGQRMAFASGVVFAQRAGRSVGGGFFAGRGTSALRVSRPALGPSRRFV